MIVFSLLIGVVLLAALLISKSSQLANVKSEIVSNVSIGPLGLIQIHKAPINGGFQASIKILPGLFVYLIMFVSVPTILFFVRETFARK